MLTPSPQSLAPAFIAFPFGLCLGSFLNVCIHRLPQGISIVHPRSRCPRCRTRIRFYDNIPILSFLWLGGRCRKCRKPISLRYPLVEFVTGVLTAGLVVRWQENMAWACVAVVAAAALVAITFIDWDTFLIPDELSLGLLGLGLVSAWFNPYFEGGWKGIQSSLIGIVVGGGSAWLMAVIGKKIFKKEALGGGDVKLLAAVGGLVSWEGALSTLLIASFLGTLYGVPLLVLKKLRRQDPIPFGPFLSLGAIINLFTLVRLNLLMWE
ncbi:MAG: prepilin peptidase [Elusimicrobia bacterium]|nr:prepilin peptidase [Elusimicrobiota bacterium]